MSSIRVQVGDALLDELAVAHRDGWCELRFSGDFSVNSAIKQLGLHEPEQLLVIVNDTTVPPSERGSYLLRGGDELRVLLPIRAG